MYFATVERFVELVQDRLLAELMDDMERCLLCSDFWITLMLRYVTDLTTSGLDDSEDMPKDSILQSLKRVLKISAALE
jgi:hypothetical protein